MTTKDLIREFISSAGESWRKATADPQAFVDEFVTRHQTHSYRLEAALFTKLRDASKLSSTTGVEKLEEIWTLVKKNRGRKILLATADRQYAAFMERVKEVNSNQRFGMEIPLVILCGSYLRREPMVGDIDVVTLFAKRRNFADREREILRTKCPGTIFEQIFAVELDVQRFLQHGSSWIHQVHWEEFQQLTCDYKIVHAHGEIILLTKRHRASPAKLKAAFEEYRRFKARSDGD